MATEKVVIDPITRIEGHLRIELEREGDKIKTAWSETTQFRGIETIVKDRDPRDVWAFVGRICGVCAPVLTRWHPLPQSKMPSARPRRRRHVVFAIW